VVINGMSSRSSRVLSGVPRGSILGPLLFLIYIDVITDIDISMESRLVLYADDILLFRPIHTIGDYSALQTDIDALSNWATQNTMTFNTAKCKYMRISRKKKCSISAPSLSWSQHIRGICSKARKIIGMLYRHYYQYADSNTLLKLYTSLIRPHVEYAAPVWDPSTVQDIQYLESVQKFALRVSSKQWDLVTLSF